MASSESRVGASASDIEAARFAQEAARSAVPADKRSRPSEPTRAVNPTGGTIDIETRTADQDTDAAWIAKPRPIPARLTPTLVGDEPLRFRGCSVDADVLSFWRWSSSELLGNALRGKFAEYVVALATGARSPFREEWDAVDLTLPDGTTVEVKSASYLQSWTQERHSTITFDIAPRHRRTESSGYGEDRVRAADVYVFCVLVHRDHATVDPLDLDQWEFHVLPTRVLDDTVPNQKRIGLNPLSKLGTTACDFGELGDGIRRAGERRIG